MKRWSKQGAVAPQPGPEVDGRLDALGAREIKVERVTAVFGKASDHETCDKKGKAARSL